MKNTDTQQPTNNYVGLVGISSKGQKMEIVEYFRYSDITVKFEDGTLVYHTSMSNFKTGKIANPNFWRNHYVGMTKTSKFGLKMTIIEYYSSENMTVQFEDGYIAKNVKLGYFKSGNCLGHPNMDRHKSKIEKNKSKYLGLKSLSSDGYLAEIVEYVSWKNITIKFEDGTLKHTRNLDVSKFINHDFVKIKNYSMPLKGTEYLHSCGLKYKLIDYIPNMHKSGSGAIIEFEDGIRVEHISRRRLLKQKFSHPLIKLVTTPNVIQKYYSKDYFGYRLEQEFNVGEDIYYNIKKDDVFVGIMTLQELLKYKEEVAV